MFIYPFDMGYIPAANCIWLVFYLTRFYVYIVRFYAKRKIYLAYNDEYFLTVNTFSHRKSPPPIFRRFSFR